MAFAKSGRRQLRLQEIERDLPLRMRKEPKPGDNPLKRPYPPHAHDIEEVDALLEKVPREIPTEFCKRDIRTITRPHGVLYFHVLDIQDVKLSSKDFIKGAPFCIYVEFGCQGEVKCSYPVYTQKIPKIRIDHYAHFTAEVSELRSDESNDFIIHVYAFQDPEKHWLIGSQLFHMYNFVREIHGITTIQIQDDLSYYVGKVTFEFAWAYGSFGYGYSNQLRNTKNPVYESVCHSMFPRIATDPKDLIDNKFRVRVPKRLRLVNLHSLLVRVPSKSDVKTDRRGIELAKSIHKKEDLDKEAKSVVFRRAKYSRGRPVHVALNLDIHQKFMENDFNQSYGEFVCLRNRRERLEHLTRMVEGRLRDRIETDASELFHPINDIDECRTALTLKKPLACPPGYVDQVIHPPSCLPKQPVKLDESDEKFISGITSAPRYSGYLAKVFGYAEPDEDKPVEKVEFQVSPYAYLSEGDTDMEPKSGCQWLRYKARFIRHWISLAFLTFVDYIFPTPTARHEMLLPEISVTLPSPADSTTEFYAHCLQEKVYPKVAELAATKREAAKLVRVTRRKGTGDLDEDDDYNDDKNWQTDESEEPEYEFLPEKTKAEKRFRDVRALKHAEKAKFGTQYKRVAINQNNFLDLAK